MNRTAALDAIAACLAEAGIDAVRSGELKSGQSAAGAYILAIELEKTTQVNMPRRPYAALAEGTYFYVGSANGPGGIAARLKRHFKRDKKRHWHVDQLTTVAAHVEALAVPGGNECALAQALIHSGRYQFALQGFGSSDCRTCEAHLLTPVFGAPN